MVRIPQILIAIAVLISSGHSQTNDDASLSRVFWDDVVDVATGVGSIYTAPIRWETIDFARGGLILAGGFAAYQLDDESRGWIRPSNPKFQHKLTDLGDLYGRASTGAVVSLGMYATGLLAGDQWLRGTGVVLIQTLLAAGSINVIAKPIIGRSRPYTERGHHDFRFWSWSEDSYSLPSGHTVVAFGISSVLAARIKNPWVTAGLYSLAGVTAWSRMYEDQHWLSDVVVAAAFSSAVGLSLTARYERKGFQPERVQIIPSPRGLTISYRL